LTNTYYTKSKKEEKQRILKRDQAKQLADQLKQYHKKTNSDSNYTHFRGLSLEYNTYNGGMKAGKVLSEFKDSQTPKKTPSDSQIQRRKKVQNAFQSIDFGHDSKAYQTAPEGKKGEI